MIQNDSFILKVHAFILKAGAGRPLSPAAKFDGPPAGLGLGERESGGAERTERWNDTAARRKTDAETRGAPDREPGAEPVLL